jgi:hypothetical protein
VLQWIQNESGIRFSLPDALTAIPITVSFKAHDWTKAVMRLLEGFNKVELWDSAQRLSRVILLESKGARDVGLAKERAVPNDGPHPSELPTEVSQSAEFSAPPSAVQVLADDPPLPSMPIRKRPGLTKTTPSKTAPPLPKCPEAAPQPAEPPSFPASKLGVHLTAACLITFVIVRRICFPFSYKPHPTSTKPPLVPRFCPPLRPERTFTPLH